MWRFLRILAPALLLTISGSAAIQQVDCREPRVFPKAAVNAVILPYEYIGSDGRRDRSEAALRLRLILQRDALLALLGYSSIATVQMISPRGPGAGCDANLIANQLLGKERGASATLEPGNGAVFLWGVLYEEGDDLYIRSFLRILRNVPGGDEVTMKAGDMRFSGEMPAQSVPFPPVRVRASDLREIERAFRESSMLRSTPDENAEKYEIPFNPNFPFAYTVEEAKGEWMRIQALDQGPSGWMHAGAHIGESPLRVKMPEINFLVSAVGYLQALIAKDAGRTEDVIRNVRLSRLALTRFETAASMDKTPETAAAVRILSARLAILPGSSVAAWKSATAELERAMELNPSDPALRNFRSMCRAWLIYNKAADYSTSGIVEDLKEAATRSSDPRVLNNLATWYRAMLADPRLRPTGESAIRAELAKVEKVQGATRR